MAHVNPIAEMTKGTAIDREWYDKLNEKKSEWKKIREVTLEPHHGITQKVNAGQILRISQPGEIGNITDLMFLHQNNLYERNNISVTGQNEGLLIKKYSRIWSGQPYCRPMATCIEDTLDDAYLPFGYGNHFFFSHCTSESIESAEGRINANSCHTNFYQGLVEGLGMPEFIAAGENAVVFQPFSLGPNEDGSQVIGKVDVVLQSKQGDYVDFYAEIDLVVALSICPQGQNVMWSEATLVPMTAEIWETDVEPKPFKGFYDWRKEWPEAQRLDWREKK